MKERLPQAPAAGSPDIAHGDDVREIRYRFGQSQSDFATMLGVSLPTLQSWEEGKRLPDGPALALLRVAAKNPKMVAKALGH